MSMGNSQLVQWNFHSAFRSGRAVQRGKNSSMLDMIQWKHQDHHDLQTTTNPLYFKLQNLLPRYWANNTASMNVSQPRQLIKSCRLSVDHAYLLAALILWWWNRLDSGFRTTYLPLRPNIFWLRKVIEALFQLHNLEKIWDQVFITNYLMAGYGYSSSAASEIKEQGREIVFHHFSFTIQLTGGSDLGQRHSTYVEGHAGQPSDNPEHSTVPTSFRPDPTEPY